MRNKLIIALMTVLAFSACTEKNFYEDSSNDRKAQQMLSISSLFENLARQPEMYDELVAATEALAGYSNISELAPLTDKAIAERGKARGQSIGICIEAIGRMPELQKELEALCIRFLGANGDGTITDEINNYSTTAALASLNSSIARNPIMAEPLKAFADKVLGTKLGIKDNTVKLLTVKNIGDEITLGIFANGDYTVEGATKTSKKEMDYYSETYCDIYVLNSNTVTITGELTMLNCYDNSLEALYLGKSTSLERLQCRDNQLTSLDISNLPNLRCAILSNNQLNSLDISQNTALDTIYLYKNYIPNLDVSQNTNLKLLDVSYNSVSSIDVSTNRQLERLYCNNNSKISKLDLSNNPDIQLLSFGETSIRTIDLSSCTKLEYLYGEGNLLPSIDLSHNTKLKLAMINNNEFTTLDVSGLDSLSWLQIYNNNLKGTNMDDLIATLPDRSKTDKGILLVYAVLDSERNEITQAQVAAAKKRGWVARTSHYGDYYGIDYVYPGGDEIR